MNLHDRDLTAPSVGVVPMETRRDVVVHLARRAEELGYSGFFVAEGWGLDATVVLAEIAARTQRIRIGSSVLNVWGRSPATIAMSATTLADLSGGRYVLGLGAGSPALAEGLHGIAYKDPVGRLESVTQQVRRLLDGHRLDPATDATMPPLRLATTHNERVPIALAALGPRAMAVTGRLADAWTPFFLPRSALPAAIQQLSANGHAPDGVRPLVWPGVPVAVSTEPDRAAALAAWWITFYLTRMGPLYPKFLHRLGYGAAVEAVTAHAAAGGVPAIPAAALHLIDELTLSASPDHARAQLDRWYSLGADTPCLVLPPGADPDELDRILTELAPASREATAIATPTRESARVG
jgi:alkanesulfonate monooxygenase SsuD/methylene tetrahydromethanopterin reductase-like flavin-dependent oxidoreductase (luciferase family)